MHGLIDDAFTERLRQHPPPEGWKGVWTRTREPDETVPVLEFNLVCSERQLLFEFLVAFMTIQHSAALRGMKSEVNAWQRGPSAYSRLFLHK